MVVGNLFLVVVRLLCCCCFFVINIFLEWGVQITVVGGDSGGGIGGYVEAGFGFCLYPGLCTVLIPAVAARRIYGRVGGSCPTFCRGVLSGGTDGCQGFVGTILFPIVRRFS